MNTEWTVVEVGIILAALGIYDAEVGSSGGRCGTGSCTDVGGERFETSRAASSVVEVVMYSSNHMISRKTELKPKFRGKRSNNEISNHENRNKERRETGKTKENPKSRRRTS